MSSCKTCNAQCSRCNKRFHADGGLAMDWLLCNWCRTRFRIREALRPLLLAFWRGLAIGLGFVTGVAVAKLFL